MNPDNIRIVLVGTTHPGNIGSSARALKTMGLHRLLLVQPEAFPHPQARANAAHALDVLERAEVHADLDSALAGAALVAGLTNRARRLGAPAIDLRSFARLAVAESARHPVALLFGREHSGLSNQELDRCQYAVHMPVRAPARSIPRPGSQVSAMSGSRPPRKARRRNAGASRPRSSTWNAFTGIWPRCWIASAISTNAIRSY